MRPSGAISIAVGLVNPLMIVSVNPGGSVAALTEKLVNHKRHIVSATVRLTIVLPKC
jgi:hypothetical protein